MLIRSSALVTTFMILAGGGVHSNALADARLVEQRLHVTFDLESNTARVDAELDFKGTGSLAIRLSDDVVVESFGAGITAVMPNVDPVDDEPWQQITFPAPAVGAPIRLTYVGTFDDDPEAGERTGQIHNFAVDAHVSESGIFLSDGSYWHPVWIDPNDEQPGLTRMAVSIEPLDGWHIVASGNPATDAAPENPCWEWKMPRPIDGVSIVGGPHVVHTLHYESEVGPDFDIVMQVTPSNAAMCDVFLNEAARYMAIYEERLGPFPFERFTIVENFFSSGFAFPGFTLLGPRVIPMGERALMPGYLDHEILHNWWGNGIYIDRRDGNWCEALATYGANYYRRIFDDGEEAGLEYRRGTLSKLAADAPTLDNGPLGVFGLDPELDRFVAYDKGAFVFIMLETLLGRDEAGAFDAERGREKSWAALRRFAADNMGQRADWSDVQRAFEDGNGEPLDEFFHTWVREHTVPDVIGAEMDTVTSILKQQIAPQQTIATRSGVDEIGEWLLVDPDFRLYRILPIDEIVPTVSATLGKGGTHFVVNDSASNKPTLAALTGRYDDDADGMHTFVIGRPMESPLERILADAENPITFDASSFTVAGQTYGDVNHAVLHTIHKPDEPGAFITVFISNGEAGWARLPYASFYSRNSTVVWDGREVVRRETFQPDPRWRAD